MSKDYSTSTHIFTWRDDMKHSPLIAYFRRKTLVEKDNILLGIVGATGSGKSTAAIRIAEQYDPSFHIGRIIFEPKDFLRTLSDFEVNTKGRAIIFDEAGIGNNAKKWYSYVNRTINEIMQSTRFRRSLIIFTMPSFDDIDKANRRLFKVEINTLGVNYSEGYIRAKVYLRKFLGSAYNKDYVIMKPRMFWQKRAVSEEYENSYISRVCIIDGLKILAPNNKGLWEEYERKKEKWAQDLYSSRTQELALQEEIIDVHVPRTYEEMKKAVVRNPEKYCQWVMSRNAWKLRVEKVRRAFQLNRYLARNFCMKLASDPEAEKRGIIFR